MRRRKQRVVSEAQPSKLVGVIERVRSATKTDSEINNPGDLSRGSGEVAAASREYYDKMFSSRDDPPWGVLDQQRTVPEDVKASINNPTTLDGIKSEVQNLLKNKSPGPDRIVILLNTP